MPKKTPRYYANQDRLDKETCRKCYHEHIRVYGSAYNKEAANKFLDNSFLGGMVQCPVQGKCYSMHWDPPENCPYKFEHGVAVAEGK